MMLYNQYANMIKYSSDTQIVNLGNNTKTVKIVPNDKFIITHICKLRCNLGNSTGFFYKINGIVFIATNIHCISKNRFDVVEFIDIEYFNLQNDLVNRERKLKKNINVFFHDEYDVCLIKTDIDNVRCINNENICQNLPGFYNFEKIYGEIDMHPEICMYTYYVNDENPKIFPFFRKGYLSQNICDINTGIIYGDINTIGGHSGSPVYIITNRTYPWFGQRMHEEVLKEEPALLFIGINSGEEFFKSYIYNKNNKKTKNYIKERSKITRIIDGISLLDIEKKIINNEYYKKENNDSDNQKYIDDENTKENCDDDIDKSKMEISLSDSFK